MNSSNPASKDRALAITGGCGFIGLNLLYHLAPKGCYSRYVILDNLSVGRMADLESVLGEPGSWQIEESDAPCLGPVRILYEAERAGEIRRSFSDISRARRLLGYRPVCDLDTGPKKTWEWFLARRERGD